MDNDNRLIRLAAKEKAAAKVTPNSGEVHQP
jgi:hypothetical protein